MSKIFRMLRDHPDVSLLRKKLCCSGAFEIKRQIIAELHYLWINGCLKGGEIGVAYLWSTPCTSWAINIIPATSYKVGIKASIARILSNQLPHSGWQLLVIWRSVTTGLLALFSGCFFFLGFAITQKRNPIFHRFSASIDYANWNGRPGNEAIAIDQLRR